MALERRQPLPPGRYWVDVVGPDHVKLFDGWLQAFAQHITIEEHEVTQPIQSGPNLPPLRPGVEWFLFHTDAPLVWFGSVLGFPTIATPEVKTKADTQTVPVVPPLFGGLNLDGVGSIVLLAVAAYLVFGSKK